MIYHSLRYLRPLFVIGLLVLLTLTFLFSHANNNNVTAINSRAAASRVCSHRASVGGGTSPSTETELAAALHYLSSQGILCYDVDIIAAKDGTIVVSHPSSTTLNSNTITLPVFLQTLSSLSPGITLATATLELNGALRGDVVFAQELVKQARNAGVLDQIAVDGLPKIMEKEFNIAVPLRDRPSSPGGSICGLPIGWKEGSSDTDMIAAIESVTFIISEAHVLQPSLKCLHYEPVREALKIWKSTKTTGSGSVGGLGMIQVWIVDTEEHVRNVLKDSGDLNIHFISNEPVEIKKILASAKL